MVLIFERLNPVGKMKICTLIPVFKYILFNRNLK